MQIAALPRGIGESLVARLAGLRSDWPAAILPSSLMNQSHWRAATAGSLATALSTDCGAIEQVLAAQANEWIERERVPRGLVEYGLRLLGAPNAAPLLIVVLRPRRPRRG